MPWFNNNKANTVTGLYTNLRGSIEYSMWAMSGSDLGQILANIWTAPWSCPDGLCFTVFSFSIIVHVSLKAICTNSLINSLLIEWDTSVNRPYNHTPFVGGGCKSLALCVVSVRPSHYPGQTYIQNWILACSSCLKISRLFKGHEVKKCSLGCSIDFLGVRLWTMVLSKHMRFSLPLASGWGDIWTLSRPNRLTYRHQII